MKTEYLYYQDAYTVKFQANVIEQVRLNGRLAVILDKTYFYPTSGGQPHDVGQIGGTAVTNVTIRPEDGAILHWVSGEIWSSDVNATINWDRRFDHMQQHTGQHILSQAFLRAANARTVSFHLTDDNLNIDLHTNQLTPNQVELAEGLANQVIWENRPIHIRSVTPEQAEKLDLRKIPDLAPTHNRNIRLIEIEGFDLSACGGTHVARTGEVGMIKLIKLERQGEELRVSFRCGRRALQDYRQKNSLVNALTSNLTTGPSEILDAIVKMQEELKQTRRLFKQQQNDLMLMESAQFLAEATRKNNVLIVNRVFKEREFEALRALAGHLTKQDNVVALLALAGPKTQLLFARSAKAPGDMNELLKAALQLLGAAAGGGNATMAQGGGPESTLENITQALARAEKLLLSQLR